MPTKRKLDEYNEAADVTRGHGSQAPKDRLLPIKTYRMTNIPLAWTVSKIYAWLQWTLGIGEFDRGATVRTLAIDHDRRSKVATISFRQRPKLLDESSSAWQFPVVAEHDEDSEARHIAGNTPVIYFDDHFRGFTVLSSYDESAEHSTVNQDPLDRPSTVESYPMDLVAISGLGGHAFGSFKERGGSHMWLADALPKDLPGVRILIYGYDTKLEANNSFQSFEGLASAFRLKLSSIRQGYDDVPLVLLAHSLGGIVVKEALIQLWRDNIDRKMLNAIYGMIFFGVPSQGMDIKSLIPIVDDQPNEFMLHALGRESPALLDQRREFNSFLKDRELELFCFYESSLSPTAVRQDGVLKMAGPLSLLVGKFSAIDGARDSPFYRQELKRDHSSIVKFSDNDDDYQLALQVLKRFRVGATQTDKRPLTPDENACLRTLSFPDMSKRLSTIEAPLAGTCHWLCQNEEYRSWLEGRSHTNQLLWIKGKPGAGKSTLLKHALACLESQTDLKSSYTHVGHASFFFNARGADLERNSVGMFRGLLHQLFQSIPALRSQVMKKYNEKKETMSTWSWHREELQNLFTFLVSLPRNYEITIFVDAFDECQSEKEARELVLYFMRLVSAAAPGNVKLRICLSSRHHPNFPDHDCRQIWVEDNNHGDIERYIRDRLGEDYTLEAKPSGVFLWVVLIIPELAAKIHGLTAKRRKKLIRELPPELDDIYKRQLDSVQEKNDPQALAIIRWVLFSLRPLRLSELRSVLGFSNEAPCKSLEEWHNSDEFPDSNKIMFHLLQELSGGLLETRGMREDHDADTDLEVQLIHESVRDFLIRSNGLRLLGFTNSTLNDVVHEELKRFCIHYLTVSELQTGFWDLEEDNADFPFLEYACQYLLLHASSAEVAGVSQEQIFQQLCHLNDQTFCWKITKDGVGSIVAQGSLTTIIALQDKLLAALDDADRFGLMSYKQVSAIPDRSVIAMTHQPDRHVDVVDIQVDQRTLPDFGKSSVGLGPPAKGQSNSIEDFQTLLKFGLELSQPVDVSTLWRKQMGIGSRTAEMRYVLTGRRPIVSAESGALGLCIWADDASPEASRPPGPSTPDAMDTQGPFDDTPMSKDFYFVEHSGQHNDATSNWHNVEDERNSPLARRDAVGGRPIPQIVITMDASFET